MTFSVVFGLGSGAYFALMSPITANIVGMENLQTGVAMLVCLNSVSMFGPTVSTAIESNIDVQPFLTFKMFSGFAYLAGSLLLIVLKLRADRRMFAKV